VTVEPTFADRHVGPRPHELAKMLEAVGYDSLDALIHAALPAAIRTSRRLDLPPARREADIATELRRLAELNEVFVSMIGQGYYGTHTPAAIRRNLLENPAWYTAYTPYQAEIAQGRLELGLIFQTMVADLTGLPIANASLLDEATAAAEAVMLMRRVQRGKPAGVLVVDADMFPQTLAVVRARAEVVGLSVVVTDVAAGLPDDEIIGVLLQHPSGTGAIRDLRPVVAAAKERGALVAVGTDLLALTRLISPGELGADIAFGSSQRFGTPLFFGGPHAAFMSVRAGLERNLPGRLVGVSIDSAGQPALRLALATREQHIRREKATSNICTAQALLADVAAAYAIYHGADGLRAIADRVHQHARDLADRLIGQSFSLVHEVFFDTLAVRVDSADAVLANARAARVNLRKIDETTVGISCDETTVTEHLDAVCNAFGSGLDNNAARAQDLPAHLLRTTDYLTHPVFHQYRSETALMRFLRKLADKDLALDRTMIPLGSCTMKLTAAVEIEPITLPGFANIHPYAPTDQTKGYQELITTVCEQLAEITGYAKVSVQPNAGSQGELAGLLAIRRYHDANGGHDRNICLIPASAHGTNAASAVLAGMQVVVVGTAPDGAIDEADLAVKIAEHTGKIAAIMITYPSTHGVYEPGVRDVCAAVHAAGGQVYIDGANLNALVGLARPGEFGGDVSHLNLHKTFAMPHGGGGPGVGPVCVAEHLVPYLPSDPLDPGTESGPVSAANFGSAGLLPITYAYLALMGPDGLTRASQVAVLAANYLAKRLEEHFPLRYAGENGLIAHECLLDFAQVTKVTGVTAEDVAKRLADYGFHAPTLAFPVPGTLMVEPTESEDLAELDRFVTAMVSIKAEINAVGTAYDLVSSPLRNAPHTVAVVCADEWDRPYSRTTAAFPAGVNPATKYWTPVGRIDNAYGDRHLVCICQDGNA
jgi:glycine dehydrogenase